MKKIIFLFLIFSISVTYGQNDLTGMKFCIDPGHGNYPNVKPFETRINLRVAKFLKSYLRDYGASVIITRQDSVANPSLNERENIANSNNVDFFISVHHNAFHGNANYSVVFYEAKSNGQPEWAGQADVMATILAGYLHKYLYTTDAYVRGDLPFLGFNLGVLNDLAMPGVLTEASFWDYAPEVHRMNALGYLNLEGYGLNHGFLSYYSIPKKTTPFVEGVVQDLTGEKLTDIKVTLTNGADSAVFVTDSQDIGITDADRAWGGFPQIYDVRNGMYFFENFPLGRAKLIFEGDGLVTDSVDMMVIARTSTRISPKTLVENIPPMVVSSTPVDGDSSFSAFDEISIVFSRPMDRATVENAFQLDPQVEGALSWKDNNRNLIFTTQTHLDFDRSYTLHISEQAMDAWGFFLDGNGDGVAGDEFALSFQTAELDTTIPIVVDFYPVKNDTGIFVNDLIRAEYNKQLDPSSVSGAVILLMSETHRRTSVLADYTEWNDRGIISILPKELMKPDMKYFLTIAYAITDLQGNQMATHFQWTFHTQQQELRVFSIEDFETESSPGLTPLGWRLTSLSENDTLKLSAERFAHGNGSMAIQYNFETGLDSLAALVDHASDTTWLKPGGIASVNIFGDHCGNQLRFIFEDEDGFEASQPVVIDWSGWKNLRFKLAVDSVIAWGTTRPGNGRMDSTVHIAGFSLSASQPSNGKIYIDDVAQLFVPSPTSIQPGTFAGDQPTQFKLYQNYPNPFNPRTTIAYTIPTGHAGFVQLKIFDVAGKEIRTLLTKAQAAGHHTVLWNGRDNRGVAVASGIYFCQLKLDDLVQTQKMLLVR